MRASAIRTTNIPTAFLKFSRHDESEADYFGTQYMYAAGYDPTGAISIFEKIQALSKTKPSLAARIFSSHPMDSERIKKTEEEIQKAWADYRAGVLDKG